MAQDNAMEQGKQDEARPCENHVLYLKKIGACGGLIFFFNFSPPPPRLAPRGTHRSFENPNFQSNEEIQGVYGAPKNASKWAFSLKESLGRAVRGLVPLRL